MLLGLQASWPKHTFFAPKEGRVGNLEPREERHSGFRFYGFEWIGNLAMAVSSAPQAQEAQGFHVVQESTTLLLVLRHPQLPFTFQPWQGRPIILPTRRFPGGERWISCRQLSLNTVWRKNSREERTRASHMVSSARTRVHALGDGDLALHKCLTSMKANKRVAVIVMKGLPPCPHAVVCEQTKAKLVQDGFVHL